MPQVDRLRREDELEDERSAASRAGSAAPEVGGAAGAVLESQRTIGNARTTAALTGGQLARFRAASPVLARRTTGNPGDLPQTTNATGAITDPGTVHAAPELADARNHKPSNAVASGVSVAEKRVKVRATSAAPIVTDKPAMEDLFEEQQTSEATETPDPAAANSTPAPTPDGFATIDEIEGDADNPVVDEAADESLFIDPGPKASDVQQGGIGDCWDMATFISIVNRDPNKIKSMMAPDGSGGATVTFFKRTMKAPGGALGEFLGLPATQVEYEPEAVVADNTLAFNRSTAAGAGPSDRAVRTAAKGLPYGHRLRGAALRAGEAPKETRWFADIVGRKLRIHRLDVFQMARWVPIMEKAAARFSERFGQYGQSQQIHGGNEAMNPTQGYQNLEGGISTYTLASFYGKDAELQKGGQSDTSYTAWTPNQTAQQLLTANSAAFNRLLLLNGRGASGQATDSVPVVIGRGLGGDYGWNQYTTRFIAALGAAQADADWANLTPQAQNDLLAVQTAINTWTAAAADPTPLPSPPPAGGKAATKQAAITTAQQAANPTRNPDVSDNARSSAVKAMLDMLLVITNSGTDQGTAARSVYSGHAYSVLSCDIKDTKGQPFSIQALPEFLRPMAYSFVDIQSDAVTLRNPHHANAPDPTGTGPNSSDPASAGQFTVSLERFFRLITGVGSAEIDIPGGS